MIYISHHFRKFGLYFLGLVTFLLVAGLWLYTIPTPPPDATPTATDPFPLGVDPQRATITEQAMVDVFYAEHLASKSVFTDHWTNRFLTTLKTSATWQQLASPVSRIFVVWPGDRSEAAANHIGDVLRWNELDRQKFLALIEQNNLQFKQGFILPDNYTSHRYATPDEIASLIKQRYETEVTTRYSDDIESVVPFADALIIASLIEREASDFENMRQVSGVIWNRLFIDMPLQLDASLQYAKSTQQNNAASWPAVRPEDKFIDSPYNTYQNTGLPPAPIANPSIEAIVAALNPRVTDCLYYFHSRDRKYYCSVTYEEHVSKLKKVYGQGR